MNNRPSHNGERTLLCEIIDTLEDGGLDPEQYQLQNSIDVESLERLVDSAGAAFEIRFRVEGMWIQITPDEVQLIDTPAEHD